MKKTPSMPLSLTPATAGVLDFIMRSLSYGVAENNQQDFYPNALVRELFGGLHPGRQQNPKSCQYV